MTRLRRYKQEEQVGEAIHPHPTQTELFGDMARRLLSRLRRSRKTTKA